MTCHQFRKSLDRRSLLKSSACGFGSIALAAQLGMTASADGGGATPAIRFPRRAKRIIFLFMWGGPSHVDTFDPKPRLNKEAGKEPSRDVLGERTRSGQLLGSPFQFRQHGEGGVWISELFPELAKHADRLSVIRSMHTEGSAHGEALLHLHTGQSNLIRPSVGAWISYGLGSENENLPAFVTVSPPRGHGGVQNYGNAFLPARHQATAIGSAETPIKQAKVSNLENLSYSKSQQRQQLDLIQTLNRRHAASVGEPQLNELIENYELAFRMQTDVPSLMDTDAETAATHRLYGIGNEPTDNFGRQCLLARKLAESGVRYIQVSTDYTWDHHQQVVSGLRKESARVDLPISGLLTDLTQRGLLEDTLVVWGAEFGRTPTAENAHGRNHHPDAFTMWMAGGGVKGGNTYGSTDDYGFFPQDNPVHMHDLHATLLYALGLDHERLTYRYAGRDFRLTDVYGRPVKELWA